MKILFINKYDTAGGAAIAAWRLHEQLEDSYHTENTFLVGIKRSDRSYVMPTRKAGFENFFERAFNFGMSKFGLQYVIFPFSTRRILKLANELKPDIISLHNIHSGYFKTELLKPLSKLAPVVWTLHDMWAFTANAAYTFEDEGWKDMRSSKDEWKYFPSIGLHTGNWLLRRKRHIYEACDFTMVTPSRWLRDLALQSPLLAGKEILQIYNGVDLKKYVPAEKAAAKKALGIDPGMKVITFSADDLMNSDYKGGDVLIEVLKRLDREGERRCLLTIGKGKIPKIFSNLEIHEMGYVSNQDKYIDYLRASDVFIFPTKADNLPNTLVEATACGIPVITFDVGGCPEVIRDGQNGFIVDPKKPDMFVLAINRLLEDEELYQSVSHNARTIAEKHFDIKDMANSYMNLFNRLLEK